MTEAGGSTARKQGEMAAGHFLPFIQPRATAHWMVLLTSRVCLPTLVSLIQKTPHTYVQRLISYVILDPVKLTVEINHLSKGGIWEASEAGLMGKCRLLPVGRKQWEL